MDVEFSEQDVDFPFTRGELVSKQDEEQVLPNMESGVLYQPVSWQFPACDLLWKDATNGVCGIQVTFGKEHKKDVTTFHKLYAKLGLSSRNKLTVYFVPSVANIQEYAKKCRNKKSFIKGTDSDIEAVNVDFACLTADYFSPDKDPQTLNLS